MLARFLKVVVNKRCVNAEKATFGLQYYKKKGFSEAWLVDSPGGIDQELLLVSELPTITVYPPPLPKKENLWFAVT